VETTSPPNSQPFLFLLHVFGITTNDANDRKANPRQTLIAPPKEPPPPPKQKREKIMKSISHHTRWNLIIMLFLVTNCVDVVFSKVWNAHELIIGEWDLELRGGWFFSPQNRIFPLKTSKSSSTTNRQIKKEPYIGVKRRPWGSSLPCSLSLYQDGTFLLQPKEKSTNDYDEKKQEQHLIVRGYWDVLSNPYCITDRFYDQLSLRSLPRSRTLGSTQSGLHHHHHHHHRNYESVLELSCRVWGRHVRSKTLGRKAWMTHGTLMWKDGDSSSSSSSASSRIKSNRGDRRILAAFSAKRTHRETDQLGFEDQYVFGY